MTTADAEAHFRDLTEPLLAGAGVERSTMMGLPCLRLEGAFFASFDRRTGNLLVKLTEARVDELISARRAEPFAPAGRRFRAWAAIPDRRHWTALLDEALAVAAVLPAKTSGRGRTRKC